MSQSSIVKSTKNSSQELNPTLQAVIESLDVQLEAELTKYRKHRRQTEKSVTSQKNSNKQIYKTPELISVLPVDEQISSPLPSSEIKLPESKSDTSSSQTPSSDEKSAKVAIEPPTPAELTIAQKINGQNLDGDQQISQLDENNSTAPDNYLESSEKLLESLDQLKSRRQEEESNYLASLFTPLGIASMFLFLISCTTLGYVLMNPSGLKNLGLDRLLKGTSAQNRDETTIDNTQNRQEEALPKSPDLASQEFVDLDLNTLSNVNPKPTQFPSPSATVKPAVPAPISGTANTAPQPTYQPGAELDNLSSTLLPQSIPSNVTTSSSPVPSPVAQPSPKTPISSNTNSPIQSEDGWYYVVLDYENEESLYKAQQTISDAYIRQTLNDDMKIQMGAFWEPERAKEFFQELRQAGLDVKYYKLKPDNY
ncbi:MAG: hypothetical protein AB4080_00340 [Trichodesmium sp.]